MRTAPTVRSGVAARARRSARAQRREADRGNGWRSASCNRGYRVASIAAAVPCARAVWRFRDLLGVPVGRARSARALGLLGRPLLLQCLARRGLGALPAALVLAGHACPFPGRGIGAKDDTPAPLVP